MRRSCTLLVVIVTSLSVAACNQQQPTHKVDIAPAQSGAGDNQSAAAHAAPTATDAAESSVKGTVVETMDSGGYTYVNVDTGSEKVWAVAPEFAVKVGDRVTVPPGMPMSGYHSKTLDRDFPSILFVRAIVNETSGGATKPAGMAHGHGAAAAAVTDIDLRDIKKADGGVTIGELYAKKKELADKEVTLRGKVVKFHDQIMGKNWLHVRDGSGEASAHTNDLTVTTDATVKVGDTVLVSGKLHLDRDFGAGYTYDLIIEDAKVTRE